MLTNLLSNAVKYAPDVPAIEIKAHTDAQQVVISVRDHGIGLNLAMTLVDMNGGSMMTRSKKGEGSTFTIYLPIDGPEKTGQAETKVA